MRSTASWVMRMRYNEHMRRFLLVALLVLSILPTSAKDMDFKLQEKDLRPNFDLYQWIFADGDIVPGTADRFIACVARTRSFSAVL